MWLLSAPSTLACFRWEADLADEKDPCGAGRGNRTHCGTRLRAKVTWAETWNLFLSEPCYWPEEEMVWEWVSSWLFGGHAWFMNQNRLPCLGQLFLPPSSPPEQGVIRCEVQLVCCPGTNYPLPSVVTFGGASLTELPQCSARRNNCAEALEGLGGYILLVFQLFCDCNPSPSLSGSLFSSLPKQELGRSSSTWDPVGFLFAKTNPSWFCFVCPG